MLEKHNIGGMMVRKGLAILITVATGGCVGYAVRTGQYYLAPFSITVGLILLNLARRRVDEVLVDERIEDISEKSSRRALEVFGISSALFALILIVAGKEEGYILGFAVCALLILYLTLYALYSKGEIS